MNKNIWIAITATVLMAGVIAPSLTGNASTPLPTYTAEEYIAMLPDWDEIDQSEISLHPPATPAGELLWQHREWYWGSRYIEESFLETVIADYDTTIIYNWMPSAFGDSDQRLIFAIWNVSGQNWDAFVFSWADPWDNEFSKAMCDFSIDDLPLEEEWPLWMTIAIVIVALCIIVPVLLVVATYRIGKRR